MVGLIVACSLAAAALLSTPAFAATVTQRPLLFSFNGVDTDKGAFRTAGSIALDNSNGAVYVVEAAEQAAIDKFHPDGTAWAFSSTGQSSISQQPEGEELGIFLHLAVDNSSGQSQGKLFLSGNSFIESFDSNGSSLERFFPQDGPLTVTPSDAAVDAGGHLWITASKGESESVREYAATGNPPEELLQLPASKVGKLDLDSAGDIYVIENGELQKWVGGSFSSTIDPTATDVYVDQSSPSGHIFTTYSAHEEQEFTVDATAGQFRLSFEGDQTPDLAFDASTEEIKAALEALPAIGPGNIFVTTSGSAGHYLLIFRGSLAFTDVEQIGCEDGTTPLSGGSGCTVQTTKNGAPGDFQEYAPDGSLLGTFGLGFIDEPQSIAYNPSLDRVYVLQGPNNGFSEGKPNVVAFGPPQTGTVPDLSIEAPTSVGVSSAHFSGKVNPQGTDSEWRFEWRKLGQSWGGAESSPPQSLPADSNEHTVEYTTNALRGNTAYQVRLVAVNTANQLAGVSGTESFETEVAAEPPAVTIDAPSAITANTAKITGTVNPEGDTAEWRLQTSTDPSCAGGFTNQPLQQITPSSNSPVPVEFELTGLLPNAEYCARLVATNSAGSTTSEGKSFKTLETLPTQVFTAYAAPRTTSTVRLNGFLNPEGSEATYRFEYSTDGSNWTVLPDAHQEPVRQQVLVAQEVSGLQPATTYQYRFTAEDAAGAVQGDTKTFETRTVAEMQLPKRGYELVNQPDKGNQNIAAIRPLGRPSMINSDGSRVLWNVFAGAPEGNTGTEATYLAQRTSSGWVNRPVIPPSEEQIGAGGFKYKLNVTTPDFRHFVFRAVQSGAFRDGPPTFVRLDDEQHQEVLKAFSEDFNGTDGYENADVTDDGAHVLLVNPENGQLEEVGPSPEIVSVMPDGEPNECGMGEGVGNFSGVGPGAGSLWTPGYHRMSTIDASRAYFQAIPNGQACNGNAYGGIFFRDRNAQQTIEVDPGEKNRGPAMIRATPDGRSLYFVTKASHSPEDLNSTADIYRWDSESGEYACLTCMVANLGLGETSDGYDPIRISNDFSHIYFQSEKQLVPGYGVPGRSSLYVLSNGEIRFVVSTNPTTEISSDLADAALSSDGNVVVFRSRTGHGDLTADEFAAECKHAQQDKYFENCDEFYRYEDSTESLECLTCRPGGVTELSAGSSGVEDFYGISADGSTVAFVTRTALLPQDVNGGADVYEWHNGALGLISDGETHYPDRGAVATAPKVYGVDASGQDIFFSLIDPDLTGYEGDGASNIYDARIGGGFPRPQPVVHCVEEACQGESEAAPAAKTATSAAFNGQGNLKPQGRRGRCSGRRGKARRRCLHRGKRRHKRHHHERHSRRTSNRNAGGAK